MVQKVCPLSPASDFSMHTIKPRRRTPPGSARRSTYGNSLVEMVVGVLVSSIFAAAVVQSMSQGLSLTSGAQNQVVASSMAQEVLDAARNLPFATLTSYQGSWPLIVQLQQGDGPINCPPYPRPLLLDNSNFTYGTSQYGSQAITNTLTANTCSATEDIVSNSDNTCTVTVTINWRDSTGNHSYQVSTRIAQNGIGV